MKLIETLGQWRAMADDLMEDGYTLYQMQYGTDLPQGFHATFWRSGWPDIEVVTHSAAVHDAIVKFRTRI